MKIVELVLKGDKRAAGKLISMIEDDDPGATEALAAIYPHTGKAHIVGFTGPPGVGKTMLCCAIAIEAGINYMLVEVGMKSFT